ncbi:unnamed protein product, partial [Trypanosoma congolense IL3000]
MSATELFDPCTFLASCEGSALILEDSYLVEQTTERGATASQVIPTIQNVVYTNMALSSHGFTDQGDSNTQQKDVIHWMCEQERNEWNHVATTAQIDGVLYGDSNSFPMELLKDMKPCGGVLCSASCDELMSVMTTFHEVSQQQAEGDTIDGVVQWSKATLILTPGGRVSAWEALFRRSNETSRIHICGRDEEDGAVPSQLFAEYDYVICPYEFLRDEPDPQTGLPGELHMVQWNRVVLFHPPFFGDFASREGYLCNELQARSRWILLHLVHVESLGDLYGFLRFLHVPFLGLCGTWVRCVWEPLNRRGSDNKAAEILFHVMANMFRLVVKVNRGAALARTVEDVEFITANLTFEERRIHNCILEEADGMVLKARDQHASCRSVVEILKFCCLAAMHVNLGLEGLQRHTSVELSPAQRGQKVKDIINTLVEKGTRKSEFLNELERGLLAGVISEGPCPICCRWTNELSIFNCAHVFCSGCAERLRVNGAYTCPTCRTRSRDTIPVPHGILKHYVISVPCDVSQWCMSSKTTKLAEYLSALTEGYKALVFSCSRRFFHCVQHHFQNMGFDSAVLEWEDRSELLKIEQWFNSDAGEICSDEEQEAKPVRRILFFPYHASDCGMRLNGVTHCIFMHPVWVPATENSCWSAST